MSARQAGRLVWDWPLRLWHWLFAIAVAGAWITGEWGGYDWRQWHLWFGQAAVGLLIFRIAWGFVGTRHARFARFVPGPKRLMAYLKTLPRRDAPGTPGHNPLGAVAENPGITQRIGTHEVSLRGPGARVFIESKHKTVRG